METKARSVTKEGEPDGWVAPRGFRAQVASDGTTRLVVSAPPDEIPAIHGRLLAALGTPVSVRYVRLTDRVHGQLEKPESYVRMDMPRAQLEELLAERPALIWRDGRHQLWVRGKFGEQLVLDEIGAIFCYPDDPSFREAMGDLPETKAVGIDGRDYVKVHFVAEADEQERSLLAMLIKV